MPGMPPAAGVTAAQLSRRQWVFAFALITSLFFTWGFAYGLLDVLNAHFQTVFGITKLQSTLLQVAYFGAYIVWSPFASIFMRKKGYKAGIHLGLALYSIGAIFFWPSAVYQKYGGFVACTFVMACGLATLEVAANSYIAVLGTNKYAAARLNFAQGFQGIASFAGPLIASRWFFTGKNATTLDTVQWVYLAVSGLGIVLNILFYFCHLPEISENALAAELGPDQPKGSFWKQYRCIFGFVAQTCYVGAQVGVATFAVNYLIEEGLTKSHASRMFSYCQMVFTAGRFIGVVVLNFVDPALLLSFYGAACATFAACASQLHGDAGIGCLFMIFFFESICYPCIFTLATKDLGVHTKLGSGLIVMGVGGGAWYPSAQGSIANRSTRQSYLVPMSGFLVMFVYSTALVATQAMKDGLRVRNREDSKAPVLAGEFEGGVAPYAAGHARLETEKGSEEFREKV